MEHKLRADFNVRKLIMIIENTSSLETFVRKIDQFAREIFKNL